MLEKLHDILRRFEHDRGAMSSIERGAAIERDAWRTRVLEALGVANGPAALTRAVEAIETLQREHGAAIEEICRGRVWARDQDADKAFVGLWATLGRTYNVSPRPSPGDWDELGDAVVAAVESRARWRARVAPSEDRVVALGKELRAAEGRLRAAERQVEQLKQAAKDREAQHETGRLELMAGAAEAVQVAVADLWSRPGSSPPERLD